MINEKGFTRPTYAEILETTENKYKELFGADVNSSAYTPLGAMSRVQAFFFTKFYDVAEYIYNSRFIHSADNATLDLHGMDRGLPRNGATHSFVDIVIKGVPGTLIREGEQLTTPGGVLFEIQFESTIPENGELTTEVMSVEPGQGQNVEPNTITSFVEYMEEITSVTNPRRATGGTDIEGEQFYRERLMQNERSRGKGIQSAIEAALANTQGVRGVNVVYNRTLEVDSDGNPGKSIHAYLLGGEVKDIAETLHNVISATANTVGSESYTIVTENGDTREIKFDYAQQQPVFVDITLTTNVEFEATGTTQVKDAVIAYIGGTDSEGTTHIGLAMGADVVLSKMLASIYSVNGIDDVVIKVGGSFETATEQNFEITNKQVAITDNAKIKVGV